MPIWLVMVPLGQNNAASMPNISAARLLQRVYGFIFTVDVIADLGRHHGIQHALCGPGYGVTAKIYHWYPFACSLNKLAYCPFSASRLS